VYSVVIKDAEYVTGVKMQVRNARNDSDRLGIINERNGYLPKEIRRRRKLHLPCN
jgi:hypothetical protein